MINFNEDNEFFSDDSGSLDPDSSYLNVLRELNIDIPEVEDDKEPVAVHANKFGNFSIVCNTKKQTKEVKDKFGLKGFLPLYPGIMLAKNKEGKIKYILSYHIHSKMPTVCFN